MATDSKCLDASRDSGGQSGTATGSRDDGMRREERRYFEKRTKDEMSRSPFLKMFHNGNDANITYSTRGI